MTYIYALHGFLGLPKDWDNFRILRPVDLYEVCPPREGLKAWGAALNQFAASTPGERVIIGYSMGARLALHALLDTPGLWDAAVIISGHPGLKTDHERMQRLASDGLWAERFRSEPWDALIEAWNSREIFAGDTSGLKRLEKDYNRYCLADAMLEWSLGVQDDLSGLIARLPMPILWMTGERDHHYSEIAKNLTFAHDHSRAQTIPGAGHRIPWEHPDAFNRVLTEFLINLDKERFSHEDSNKFMGNDQNI